MDNTVWINNQFISLVTKKEKPKLNPWEKFAHNQELEKKHDPEKYDSWCCCERSREDNKENE